MCPGVKSISTQIHRSWNKKPNQILFPGFTIDPAAPSGGLLFLLLHPGHAIHEKSFWFQASHPNTHPLLQAHLLSSFLLPPPETTQPLSCSGYNTHVLTSCLLLPVLALLLSFLHTTVFANKSSHAVLWCWSLHPCMAAHGSENEDGIPSRCSGPCWPPWFPFNILHLTLPRSHQPSFTLDLALIPSTTGPLHTPLPLHGMLSLSVF